MHADLLFDEILPVGGGVQHEFGLRGGTVVLRAADLEARWGAPADQTSSGRTGKQVAGPWGVRERMGACQPRSR